MEQIVWAKLEDAWAVVASEARLNEWAPPCTGPTCKDHELTCQTTRRWLYTDTFTWKLSSAVGNQTKIEGTVERTRKPLGRFIWLATLGMGQRTPDLAVNLTRLKVILEAPAQTGFGADALLTLLNVYTTQFGSYTTLLWQVPVLGLTAQAFLMTIALGTGISDEARIAASALSVIIAWASWRLMHTQRGRAINQAELARRTSSILSLKQLLGGDFQVDDAMPRNSNAPNVWDVDHSIYHIWRTCMVLFFFADVTVIASVVFGLNWFTQFTKLSDTASW
jgi:hypothetical protein